MSGSTMSAVKSAMLRGWRERWTGEQWSIAVRQHIPSGASADSCQLADILLDQALIGPSPNMHLLSYLQHAISTQMVSSGAVVSKLVCFSDVSRGYCVMSLLQLTADSVIPTVSMLDDSIAGTGLSVGKSVVSLSIWLLNILYKTMQRHLATTPTNSDRLFTVVAVETGVPFQVISTKTCEVLQQLLSINCLCALGKVMCHEETDFSAQLKQLVIDIEGIRVLVNNAEVNSRIADVLKLVPRLTDSPQLNCATLDLSSHLLNITLNVFVNIEALLSPTNNARTQAQLLKIIQATEGLSDADLYVELMRSALVGLTNIVGCPEEVRWAAFTFLKLPNIIYHLVTLSATAAGSYDPNRTDTGLWQALNRLLTYSPLLNLADVKCKCDCLHYLLHELSNKYSLLSEDMCQQLHNKRKTDTKPGQTQPPGSLGASVHGSNQSSTVLVLRAECTVKSIFTTLAVDYSKNLEGILTILSQMISGKSFELILSATAEIGKLPTLIVELIKFNEMAKASTGEGSKTALSRALLFDCSFLMVCYIIQLCGMEVLAVSSEYLNSFLIQWCKHCLPEDGRFKSIEISTSADPNKVELLLGQFGSAGSELKLTLTRWNEVCHNVPFVAREVLNAWLSGAIGVDKVNVILDNMKSTMCCLAIIVSAWLCSHIAVSDGDTRQKALYMLQYLSTPVTNDSSMQYYNERSHLMHVILEKMTEGLAPASAARGLQFQLQRQQQVAANSNLATRESLLTMLKTILSRGCIHVDEVHKLDRLLVTGGAAWYTEHLVRALLTYDRPEDLYQGVGLLYGLFHADIDNLTLCLLSTTLPRLLMLHSGAPVSSSTSSAGLPPGTMSSLKLLTDPRGNALAKLCVMCINLSYSVRNLVGNSSNGSTDVNIPNRSRKRTRVEVEIDDWNSGDEDETDDNVDEEQDWYNLDAVSNVDPSAGQPASRVTRNVFSDDMSNGAVLPLHGLAGDDPFEVPEFLTTAVAGGGTGQRRNNTRPQFDSKDLLSKSLLRLFRLMHSIMSDKFVSPRTAFIVTFVKEAVRVNPQTARFILRFIPHSMVNMLVRTLPNEFSSDVLLSMCDLTTAAGRRTACKAICQQTRHNMISDVGRR